MLDEAIADARTEIKTALYKLETIMDEAEEAHHLAKAKHIELKRTLKLVHRNILAAVDAQSLERAST
ncbi:MAG: hypothetical protein FWE08_05120 [Oscillospiraceae bacterium]|nr:hypothetical protein [Oscillospiraceae bacterium]